MKDSFEIQGYTIANAGKEKNGDSYAFEYIEREGLLLAVVADGVSRQPCDWFASETACKTLVETFKGAANQTEIKVRLKESIIQTNEQLIATEGQCQKMASTLSVVVLSTKENLIYYSNIGDSRIYRLDSGNFRQMTKDDSVVTKEKVFVNGGFRIIDKHTLTKAMGQERIAVDVTEQFITSGEIIILATDGFYEARKASFNNIMERFETTQNFEENFRMAIDKLEGLRGDDFTVVAIKNR